MAVKARWPNPGSGRVIHHSDQSSQYTSADFERLCRRAEIRRSMGSVGDYYDNAHTTRLSPAPSPFPAMARLLAVAPS